jgi:hypothetical protein
MKSEGVLNRIREIPAKGPLTPLPPNLIKNWMILWRARKMAPLNNTRIQED